VYCENAFLGSSSMPLLMIRPSSSDGSTVRISEDAMRALGKSVVRKTPSPKGA